MRWWAVIHSPDAVQLCELGEPANSEELKQLLGEARELAGMPAGQPEGWDVAVTAGDPHPELVESAASVHRRSDGGEGPELGPAPPASLAVERMPHEVQQERMAARAMVREATA